MNGDDFSHDEKEDVSNFDPLRKKLQSRMRRAGQAAETRDSTGATSGRALGNWKPWRRGFPRR